MVRARASSKDDSVAYIMMTSREVGWVDRSVKELVKGLLVMGGMQSHHTALAFEPPDAYEMTTTRNLLADLLLQMPPFECDVATRIV